jgi:hypothetical protein
MKYEHERAYACIDKIKPIPKGWRRRTLRRLGELFRETFGPSGMELVSLLHVVNRVRCFPPLPEWILPVIAGEITREAERNFGRLWGGIVWLDGIPANEIEAAREKIKALPYDCSYCLSELGGKPQLYWQETFADFHSDIIDYEIERICNDTTSASDVSEDAALLIARINACRFFGKPNSDAD